MEPTAARSSLESAVDRGLTKQRSDATREVEAILDAALHVAEAMAPATPRVADIVREAGTSNQTFYRYFAGKDDLMLAVLERGLERVRRHLLTRMAKAEDPDRRIEAWIRGVLSQVSDPENARQAAAVSQQVSRTLGERHQVLTNLTALLNDPLRGAGSTSPERDGVVIGEAVFGTMLRHLDLATSPSRAEAQHLVDFCLRGLQR